MSKNDVERATLGGGCFWCLEPLFEQLNGVESVTSGYAGGHTKNPTYKEVSTGTTGHAEVIQIVFDPKIISFDELLDIFWNIHDPTTLNRQGNDVGEQYRSIILYNSEEQKLISERSFKEYEAKKLYDGKFTTQIVPLEKFYEAELHHQDYFNTVGDENPYCTYVIAPKVEKFNRMYRNLFKPEFK